MPEHIPPERIRDAHAPVNTARPSWSPPVELEGLVEAGHPVLVDLRTMYPSRHDRVTAANERFAAENPDLLKRFLKGMIRGGRWALDPANHDRFRRSSSMPAF